MDESAVQRLRRLPSVDEVLGTPAAQAAIERFGRPSTVGAIRAMLAEARAARDTSVASFYIGELALTRLEQDDRASLRPVFNLTGTILHTNLGRALIAEVAIEAATEAMRNWSPT